MNASPGGAAPDEAPPEAGCGPEEGGGPEVPHGGAPAVGAFDFDGTLTRGGSTFAFLVHVGGWWPVSRAVVAIAPQLVHAALAGGPAADRAKERLFAKAIGGLPADHVTEAAAHFGRSHLAGRLRPEVAARLAWHQQQGHSVLVVSASPECYVGPAVSALGVDAVLATRLAVVDGIMTGHFEGKNCRGSEKLRRLTAWLDANPAAGGDPPELFAYGNSRGDLRMLAAATHGYDAGRLGRLGRLRRYPRVPTPEAASVR